MKRSVLTLGVFLIGVGTGILPTAAAATDKDNHGFDRKIAKDAFISSIYPADELGQFLADGLLLDFLGEASLPAMIAQPELPMALRPTGIPVVRPGRRPEQTALAGRTLLSELLPDLMVKKKQRGQRQILPEPGLESESGIVYVLPFTRVMVPDEVYEGLFDEFVDAMNRQADILGLQFVILKEGMKRVGTEWLSVHKYITGEIYAYVEDSGANSTKISAKTHISYYHPKQKTPAFDTVLPVSAFFDHDRSDIIVERTKLAEGVATTLTQRLIPEFDTSLIGKQSYKAQNNGA